MVTIVRWDETENATEAFCRAKAEAFYAQAELAIIGHMTHTGVYLMECYLEWLDKAERAAKAV